MVSLSIGTTFCRKASLSLIAVYENINIQQEISIKRCPSTIVNSFVININFTFKLLNTFEAFCISYI